MLAMLASTGCDILFQLREVPDAGSGDAPMYYEHDAVSLDTSGWPTNGGVDPVPCSTGSTFDEDADLTTDECDNCPLDVNSDQSDQDRDGIGDVCDPHPEYAVERLAHFEGFNGAVLADVGANVSEGGAWRIEPGRLRQVGTGEVRTLFHLAAGPWREPTFHLRYGNVNRNGTSRNFFVGAYLVGDVVTDPEPDGLQCRVHYGAGQGDLEMVRIRAHDPTASSAAPLVAVTNEVSMVLAAEQLGGPPQCSGARDVLPPSELPTQLLIARDATDAAPPRFAVWTLNARADFYAYAIYETIWP